MTLRLTEACGLSAVTRAELVVQTQLADPVLIDGRSMRTGGTSSSERAPRPSFCFSACRERGAEAAPHEVDPGGQGKLENVFRGQGH